MLRRPRSEGIKSILVILGFTCATLFLSAVILFGVGKSAGIRDTLAMLSDQSAATYRIASGKWDRPQRKAEEDCALDPSSNPEAKAVLFKLDPDNLSPSSGQAPWPVDLPGGQPPIPATWAQPEDSAANEDQIYFMFPDAPGLEALIIERMDLRSGTIETAAILPDHSNKVPPGLPPLYMASENLLRSLDGTSVSLPDTIGGLAFTRDLHGDPSLLAISRSSNPATLYRITLDDAGRPTGWMSILSIEMPQWLEEDYPELTGVAQTSITWQGAPVAVVLVSFDGEDSGDGIFFANLQTGKVLGGERTSTPGTHAEHPSRELNWSDPLALQSLNGSLYLMAHVQEGPRSDCAPRIQIALKGPKQVYIGQQTEIEVVITNSGEVPVSGIQLESSHGEDQDIQQLFQAANDGQEKLPLGVSVQFLIPFTAQENDARSMVFSISATGDHKSISTRAIAELSIEVGSNIHFNKAGPDTASTGDTIEYELEIGNITAASLTNGIVSDEKIGFSAPIGQPLFQDDFNSSQLSPEWKSAGSDRAWRLKPVGRSNSSLEPDLASGNHHSALFISEGGAWENYSVLIDLRLNDQDGAEGCLGVRLDPATGGGYHLCADPHSGALRLWKADAWNSPSGEGVLIAEAEIPFGEQWHHLRVDLQSGNTIVFWDGEMAIDAETHEIRSGTVGLLYRAEEDAMSGGIEFDNLMMTPNPPVLGVDGHIAFTINHTILPDTADPLINVAHVSAENGSLLVEQHATHELRLLPPDVPPPEDMPLTGEADHYEALEDVPLVIPVELGVLINDGPTDASTLTAVVSKSTTHGSLQFDDNGAFIYTPQEDFFGEDQFTYRASNGRADSDLVSVKITIVPVNDSPIGVSDVYQLSQNQEIQVNSDLGVLSNDWDPEGDELKAQMREEPEHGGLTFSANGAFSYLPSVDFSGEDQFTYTISDGNLESEPVSVILRVETPNQAPIAAEDHYSMQQDSRLSLSAPGVMDNDLDPDGDALSVRLVTDVEYGELAVSETGEFTYAPHPGYVGWDAFTYLITDGDLESAVATVNLMVEAGNQAPTAEDDAFTATAGETAILWVLENDFDPDGDVLKIIFTSPPDHGSITNRDDGSLAYLPDRDFAGTEVLQYTIQDGSGGTDQASLTINVDSAQ